jgi:hypothetical protein
MIRNHVQDALLAPPLDDTGTEWVYQTQYPYKGSNCLIRVVVEYEKRWLEKAKGYDPAHITTAYSWWVP